MPFKTNGLILSHINHCRLFKAKSFLYTYIYIKYMISKHILLIKFLNEPELIFFFLHTVKCFQVLLFDTNNSIKHLSLVYTQLNDQTVLF